LHQKQVGFLQSSLKLIFITETAAPSASANTAFEDIPNSNIRKIIAQRLTLSKTTIPHAYLRKEICMDQLLKVRSSLNGNVLTVHK
jgi:pyruvate dehydrogenase E2 component (dihydrolipoamide acetyltransferase)